MLTWTLCALALWLLGCSPRETSGRHRAGERARSVPREVAGPRGIRADDAPLLLDLVAAVLESGAAVSVALRTVGDTAADGLEEDVGAALARVGRLLDLGADPTTAWAACLETPALQPVAAAGIRCAHSGAQLAQSLRSVATQLRRDRRDAALARADRLGVWSLLPLGSCFLPAFVCLGIVPVVHGIATRALR